MMMNEWRYAFQRNDTIPPVIINLARCIVDPNNVYLASIDFPFDTAVFVARKRDSKRKGMQREEGRNKKKHDGTEYRRKGRKPV